MPCAVNRSSMMRTENSPLGLAVWRLLMPFEESNFREVGLREIRRREIEMVTINYFEKFCSK